MLRLLNFRCSFCSSPLDETQHDGAFHDQPQLLVGPRLGGGRAARVQLRHLGLGEVARTQPLLVLVAHHRPGQALERLDRGKVSATLATLRVLAPVAYIPAIAATNARSTRW